MTTEQSMHGTPVKLENETEQNTCLDQHKTPNFISIVTFILETQTEKTVISCHSQYCDISSYTPYLEHFGLRPATCHKERTIAQGV